MKYVLLLFPVLPAMAFSQNLVKYSFSAGLDIAIPSPYLKHDAGTGFGPSMRGEYDLSDHFSAIATLGLLNFQEKGSALSSKFTMVPLQVGAKFYPVSHGREPSGLYVSAETGLHSIFVKSFQSGHKTGTHSETDFGFAPGVGMKLHKFDMSFRQQYVIRRQYVVTGNSDNINLYSNIRVAYLF
jgi:hypothetical protein